MTRVKQATPVPEPLAWRLPGSPLRMDALGAGLLLALMSWVGVAAAKTGTDPLPVLLLLGACGAAFLAGRLLGAWAGPVVPAALAAAAVVVAGMTAGTLTDSVRGLFHYGNAKAAFFALGAGAALVVATGRVSARRRAPPLGQPGGALARSRPDRLRPSRVRGRPQVLCEHDIDGIADGEVVAQPPCRGHELSSRCYSRSPSVEVPKCGDRERRLNDLAVLHTSECSRALNVEDVRNVGLRPAT